MNKKARNGHFPDRWEVYGFRSNPFPLLALLHKRGGLSRTQPPSAVAESHPCTALPDLCYFANRGKGQHYPVIRVHFSVLRKLPQETNPKPVYNIKNNRLELIYTYGQILF
jgi:hypothetical protein